MAALNWPSSRGGVRDGSPGFTLEKVGPQNLGDCGLGCQANRNNPGYRSKVEWLRRRFAEGLHFLLFRDGRLLSDHYVGKGRFRNLLQKEILKETDRRG
jgi:hypothetical protein